MEKTSLRKQILNRRKQLSQPEWDHKSKQICKHLEKLPLMQHANTVLSYVSIRQEPDLHALTVALPTKRWGFPRCVGQSLVWHHPAPDCFALQPGAYGILEPDPGSPVLHPEEVDLLLVPCVGCDRRGYRLGYGGGYYDRLFGTLAWANKPAIGILFEFAVVDELTIDPWDRALTGRCTEAGVTLFRN
ncbi:5-formyltetrahydrofolate cyclo-ligase [Myxacorys almedinensis]|uniref:5-formyltetrahydrofolate cyclo-ligase n=1 Tax=Myxacorys almedinensis A TaxID=2690445 RepID=A0A8J7Z535_9CYAN|nr:5-formyltetrahydrofolate cyclo-ligase [Myxacorys almedinensis]NDJ19974.1 5-formyltetrahydrofolate cyclo-ligase [Myxacorys almedinensis A]